RTTLQTAVAVQMPSSERRRNPTTPAPAHRTESCWRQPSPPPLAGLRRHWWPIECCAPGALEARLLPATAATAARPARPRTADRKLRRRADERRSSSDESDSSG